MFAHIQFYKLSRQRYQIRYRKLHFNQIQSPDKAFCLA
jgi:hypothetical protein